MSFDVVLWGVFCVYSGHTLHVNGSLSLSTASLSAPSEAFCFAVCFTMQQTLPMGWHFQGTWHCCACWWLFTVISCGSSAECFQREKCQEGSSEVLGGRYLGSRACLLKTGGCWYWRRNAWAHHLLVTAGATLSYYTSCLRGSQKDWVRGFQCGGLLIKPKNVFLLSF